jgi:hypothetical protein
MRKWIGPDQARPVQDCQSGAQSSPTFRWDRTGLSPTPDRVRPDWWNHWDCGHSTRECEDWPVYFRHVRYINGRGNATARDVSKAKTIAISENIRKLNRNERAACGYRPEKGINIARRCVNGYSLTAAPGKSVTQVVF